MSGKTLPGLPGDFLLHNLSIGLDHQQGNNIALKLPAHEPVCPLGWELLDDLDRFFSVLGLQSFGHTVRPQETFAE